MTDAEPARPEPMPDHFQITLPRNREGLRQRAHLRSLPPLPPEPRVSIVMPSYNQGRFIGEAIQSVLDQDYPNLELWIIDGASTDDTVEVIQRFASDPRVRWVSEPDNGIMPANYKGFRLAGGDLVGMFTSSDVYLPGTVRKSVEAFRQEAGLALLGACAYEIDEEGKGGEKLMFDYFGPESRYLEMDDVLDFKHPDAGLFFRRELTLALGGMDEQVNLSHYHFLLNFQLEALRLGGRIKYLPEARVYFRRHRHALNQELKLLPIHKSAYHTAWRRACRQTANEFQDFLNRSQRRTLLRNACRLELGSVGVYHRSPAYILTLLRALALFVYYGGSLDQLAPLCRAGEGVTPWFLWKLYRQLKLPFFKSKA